MRRVIVCLILAWFAPGKLFAEHSETNRQAIPVEFFFETGCESCEIVRRDILPECRLRYPAEVFLVDCDIGVASNYLKLVAYQAHFRVHDNASVSMVIDGRILLAGLTPIRKDLFATIDSMLADRSSSEHNPCPLPAAGDRGYLIQRVRSFTPMGIALAAIVDSVNPCAISTLVFFMSMLVTAHLGRRRMWLAGLSFIAASFFVYFLLGLGLFRVLVFLTHVHHVRSVFDFIVTIILGVLAILSFRDAICYTQSGNGQKMLLTLPARLQEGIHVIIRNGLQTRHLVAGGGLAGLLVTLIESVCTGQVYVPALALMLKSGDSVARCALFLVLYNAIFIAPLVVVLALTCGGLGMVSLSSWSRRQIAMSKGVMGVFFLIMMWLMYLLRG